MDELYYKELELSDYIELAKKKNGFKPILDDIIEKALRNIYNKKIDLKKDIEKNLFGAIYNTLNEAIIGVDFGTINEEFINQLRISTAVFAAFKTHRQQNDLAKQLLDNDGKLKSFDNFKSDTKSIIGKYNASWLRTEYDTAVIRARMAANYKKYEEDLDLFPNLKWLPSTSPNPRDTHRAFYNMVFPYDDDFLKSHYPGDEWNCKCGITNTDDPVSKSISPSNYEPSPGIDENPAFTGNLFTKTHPYVTEAYKGADKAVNSFIAKEHLTKSKNDS